MDIEIFTLADFAVDYGGRLNIIGVFDTINVRALPAIHQAACVAIRLRLEAIERGEHRLALHVVDHDGTMILPALEGQFTADFPNTQRIGSINIVLNVNGLPINRLGIHEVNLAVDGRVLGSVPFWVKQLPVEEETK